MFQVKKSEVKTSFSNALQDFVSNIGEYVSAGDGDWTVKGFIDIYRNIYTISSDTKIISKILEIHLFPKILQFAEEQGFSIVLAEHQNWYPDLSFVHLRNPRIKIAVDLKTTYRDPDFPGHVNGFTLGSHGRYFKDRTSHKNIQFPYNEYLGHYCLGVIYTRADNGLTDETDIVRVDEIGTPNSHSPNIDHGRIISLENLHSISSVIKDFQFFICEKWQLASDRQGSGNTANIGSITATEDILAGNGVFAQLGEDWFDEYWMNYGKTIMKKGSESILIRRLEDFVEFKGGDKNLIVPIRRKRRGNIT